MSNDRIEAKLDNDEQGKRLDAIERRVSILEQQGKVTALAMRHATNRPAAAPSPDPLKDMEADALKRRVEAVETQQYLDHNARY